MGFANLPDAECFHFDRGASQFLKKRRFLRARFDDSHHRRHLSDSVCDAERGWHNALPAIGRPNHAAFYGVTDGKRRINGAREAQQADEFWIEVDD